jgi:hypothetical protein
LALGDSVTWDNPDITVYAKPQFVGGTWVENQWILNNALVTVRNTSTQVAAINTQVAVSYAQVGIGLPRTPLTTQLVSLAAGGAQQLTIPLPSVVLSQNQQAVALFVDLYHPFDSNLTNDHGANSSAISLIAAGLNSSMPLNFANTTSSPVTYNLTLEPNTVQAKLESTQITVAPAGTGQVTIEFAVPSGTGSTSFTVTAQDGQGNLQGGFTFLLYYS